MTDKLVQLDSYQLALRMRSYSPRPVAPVRPRGVTEFANRGGFMDILIPQPTASNDTQASLQAPVRSVESVKSSSQSAQATTIQKQFGRTPKPKTHASKTHAKRAEKRLRLPRKASVMNFALVSMAVVVFGFGMIVAFRALKTNQQIEGTVSAQAIAPGRSEEEVKPTEQDTSSYTVAADKPRYIDIPSLGVHSRVKEAGVNADGSLGTPNNIFDSAWFNQSAKPGAGGGASLIDGHVSGPTQKGVFYGLDKLTAGDMLMIERGDGQKIYYKVVKVQVVDVDKVDMAQLLLPVTAGKAGLNLISCTGKYNSQTKQFEQRALVYAEQIQ